MTDWLQHWKDDATFWHMETTNTKLLEFGACLALQKGDTVFVPLCGKSQDMRYFLEQQYKVIGIELSSLAVEAFFTENNIGYSMQKVDKFSIYDAQDIRIFCGDYFDLEAKHLNTVRAVYDRGSLIALPADLRARYAQHLHAIIPSNCQMLLLTRNYPQSKISGPPYAVSEAEVAQLFKGFEYEQLECFDDIQNEPKYQQVGADFVEKAVYNLQKI
jgi:thiopurine S-methyltransferase